MSRSRGGSSICGSLRRICLAASSLTAGRKLVDLFPLRVIALRGRNVWPRKSKRSCSCEPVRDVLAIHDAALLLVYLQPGDEFTFTFDLGDEWRHRREAGAEKADPIEEYGEAPADPVAIWGWGSIPDQYGRTSPEG
jgi:hypothetical protein